MFRKTILCALMAAGLLAWCSSGICQEIGTIKVDDLRLRSGPGKDYRIISRLEKGTTVSIVGREKSWLKIDHDHQIGFIFDSLDFIEVTTLPNERSANQSDALKPAATTADTIGASARSGQIRAGGYHTQRKGGSGRIQRG